MLEVVNTNHESFVIWAKIVAPSEIFANVM